MLEFIGPFLPLLLTLIFFLPAVRFFSKFLNMLAELYVELCNYGKEE